MTNANDSNEENEDEGLRRTAEGVEETLRRRAAEIKRRAQEYVFHERLTSLHTDAPYVLELARFLAGPGDMAVFESDALHLRAVEAVRPPTARCADIPPKETLVRALRNLKKAVERRWTSGDEEMRNLIESPDQMIASDSPFLVCCGLLRKHKRGRVWFDEFKVEIRTDWGGEDNDDIVEPYKIEDAFMLKVKSWLIRREVGVLANTNTRIVEEAVAALAYADLRDSLKEYVEAFPPWDGEERLKNLWTRGFGAVLDVSTGQTAEYLEATARNFGIGMIARALYPGCKVDTMPVLIGPQGVLKSTGYEILGGPFYREISESPGHKDFYLQIQGVWLGDVAEMASLASTKVERDKVKAMLSRRTDNFRAPYARGPKDHPRRIHFAGNGNEGATGSLRDETGARRYNVVAVVRVDTAWLREHRDQLFAEALVYYRRGDSWWVVPEADHARRAATETQGAVFDEMLGERLLGGDLFDDTFGLAGSAAPQGVPDVHVEENGRMTHRWGNTVTALRVALQWLDFTADQATKNNTAIRAALIRQGWKPEQRTLGSRTDNSRKNARVWVPANREARLALWLDGTLQQAPEGRQNAAQGLIDL